MVTEDNINRGLFNIYAAVVRENKIKILTFRTIRKYSGQIPLYCMLNSLMALSYDHWTALERIERFAVVLVKYECAISIGQNCHLNLRCMRPVYGSKTTKRIIHQAYNKSSIQSGEFYNLTINIHATPHKKQFVFFFYLQSLD